MQEDRTALQDPQVFKECRIDPGICESCGVVSDGCLYAWEAERDDLNRLKLPGLMLIVLAKQIK